MIVSIIIPVYNVSPYIEKCLHSVMQQTYCGEMECILIDDCGTDDSIAIAQRMTAKYDGPIRFEILHHERNRGLSAARNTGTDAANGDYLFYLDSDDYISPDCIETLLKPFTEDDSIEMVQGNCVRIADGAESVVYPKDSPVCTRSNQEVRTLYLSYHHLYISVWNKLLKRSFVLENKLYCLEGIVHEDYLWMFYLTKCLKKAYLCEAVTYYHPIRPGSIVTSMKRRIRGESFSIVFDNMLHHLTAGNEKQELRGYQFIFCKRYLAFVKEVPAFHDTAKLYMKRAKEYRLWPVYAVLAAAHALSSSGNPVAMLEPLNEIRWKMKKIVRGRLT